jgi:transcriptional regulator with XRE-family HTH domain
MKISRFERSVLKWARETRFGPKIERLTDERVESWKEISSTLVAEWENGSSEPTFSQVKKLAEIYKRPLAVFFLDGPPVEKTNPPDLRTIGSHDNKNLSPEALLVVRKTRRIQQVAAGLYEGLGEKLSFKYRRFSLDENESDLGE